MTMENYKREDPLSMTTETVTKIGNTRDAFSYTSVIAPTNTTSFTSINDASNTTESSTPGSTEITSFGNTSLAFSADCTEMDTKTILGYNTSIWEEGTTVQANATLSTFMDSTAFGTTESFLGIEEVS